MQAEQSFSQEKNNDHSHHDLENKLPLWQDFVKKVLENQNERLDAKFLKKTLKIKDKHFPSNNFMINYYKQEFSKQNHFKPICQFLFLSFTSQETRTKWHRKDKLLLIWCVAKHLALNNVPDLSPCEEDWQYLSSFLGVSPSLLNLKWLSLLKTTLKSQPWTEMEDQLLTSLIKYSKNTNQFSKRKHNYQKNWTEITVEFNKLNAENQVRYAKQIRERWNNYLNPNISRDQWNNEERNNLFRYVNLYGKKWSKISKHMPGRTENQVKNQFNGTLRNFKKKLNENLTDEQIVRMVLDNEDLNIQKIIEKHQKKTEIEPIKRKKVHKLEQVNQQQSTLKEIISDEIDKLIIKKESEEPEIQTEEKSSGSQMNQLSQARPSQSQLPVQPQIPAQPQLPLTLLQQQALSYQQNLINLQNQYQQFPYQFFNPLSVQNLQNFPFQMMFNPYLQMSMNQRLQQQFQLNKVKLDDKQ